MPRDRRGDFGTYVAIRREELKINQTKMGAACGCTQTEYSNWETGKYIPDEESTVRVIARELDIPEDVLVKIWKGDTTDRANKGEHIVTKAYNTTSKGGGTTEDPY
jgi:transcriptional regulator with XRE-family HTH domain